MNERRLKNTIQVCTVLAVLLIIVLLGVLLLQTVQINVMEERRAKLVLAIDELKSETNSVQEELENRKTETYIEKYARENLGMIKKDEILFKPNS